MLKGQREKTLTIFLVSIHSLSGDGNVKLNLVLCWVFFGSIVMVKSYLLSAPEWSNSSLF